MTINYDSTTLDVIVKDDAYRYRRIMGEHHVMLYYASPVHVEVPVGAWIEFEGQTYTLEQPVKLTKHGSRNFEYVAVFESPAAKLSKYKLRNTVDGRLKFPLTATPQEHLQMLVDNMNSRESGWSMGDYVDSHEKLVSYNHDYCSDALAKMAEAFETEYEIIGKVIHLRKVEHAKSNPLPLSYGKGNGLLPGSGRANYDDSRPTEILWVQGGERNIDPSVYGGRELLLPKSQSLYYDGEFFAGEPGYSAGNARQYVTDANGMSVQRGDKPLNYHTEDSLDLTNIYPSRVGTVSSVTAVNPANNLYDFADSSIPGPLNYEACRIKGQEMTVYFESGMLAGRTFTISQYIHATRTFKMVSAELDGVHMPNDTFKPAFGDKYAIFGIMLPDAYVSDNSSQSGASWDMFKSAVRYLYDNEDPKFTVTGEVDSLWSKQNWLNIGGRLGIGYYIQFSDPDYMIDGVNIRIVGVKDYLNNPHKPKLELSNKVQSGGVRSTIKKLEENEVVIAEASRASLEFTKRRYRDAIETMRIMEQVMADYFTEAINPAAVHTMSLLVGHESLQFRFVDSKTTPEEVVHVVSYNNETKVLSAPGGIIQHLTIGIEDITSSRAAADYKFWDIPAFTSPPLVDGDKSYLLYAKVPKSGTEGEFILSETGLDFDSGSFYNLWVGVLNTEYLEERSYVDVYGFTEILPGRITAKRLVSEDGLNWFDMAANSIRIGNETVMLDWNGVTEGVLTLRGAIVQSPSGIEDILGVYRGDYDPLETYFRGDIVDYTNLDGRKGRYKYINPASSAGNLPTNPAYWKVEVEDGIRGGAVVYRGVYDADEVYYGNSTRIDVVKYGSMWYEARATAGEFTGIAPAGAGNEKWKYFGASFSSVATDLLLADKASIGNWWIEDGKIVSRLLAESETYETPRMTLDANIPEIEIRKGLDSWANTTRLNHQGLIIQGGGIELEPSNQPNAKGAISAIASGVSANFIAGVFGKAFNGAGKAYGGWFERLFVQGLKLRLRSVTGATILSELETVVIFFGGSPYTATMPLASEDGIILIMKNISGNTKTIIPNGSQKLYDDNSENPAYPITNGELLIAISCVVSGTMSWLVTSFGTE